MQRGGRLRGRGDVLLLVVAILAANVPVLLGLGPQALVFDAAAVAAGEWWRIVTHPFVHVGAYHLALDATAFLLLYVSLAEQRPGRRLGLVAGAAAGALLAARAADPHFAARGLCGLSAAAHGLMAVAALDMLRPEAGPRTMAAAGAAMFGIVVLKSALEAVTGQVALASLHIGPLGTPVAACHAGGVIGALCIHLASNRHRAASDERHVTSSRPSSARASTPFPAATGVAGGPLSSSSGVSTAGCTR
jgi:rhomboid family GlyGly-CTERM serine protease